MITEETCRRLYREMTNRMYVWYWEPPVPIEPREGYREGRYTPIRVPQARPRWLCRLMQAWIRVKYGALFRYHAWTGR